MPFITQERRMHFSDIEPVDMTPGDLCYGHYRVMVETWKRNPRWTTAHEICKAVVFDGPIDTDDIAARELAWQVFFQLYVMPYELKKREENGDI